jgi:acetyl-CoA acetyltransferase
LRDVFIVGIGMTPFGRFLDRSLTSLTEEAVRLALHDAGIGASRIEAIAFANATQDAMEGQYGIRGQVALQAMDFDAVPIINVENACASASTALNVAMMQIRSGAVEIALAIGAEKMASADTALSMGAFEGSWDRSKKDVTRERLLALGKNMPTPPAEVLRESPRTVFMDIYAAFAKYHMSRFGTTQRQLAEVAAKNHGHSVHNPLSQYRRAFSTDEVLNARLIAWPLTLPMCSPISDGAAAAVLCSGAALKELNRNRAVKIRASVLMNGGRRSPEDIEMHISRRAAKKAYDIAGLGPADIDVVECHDATAFGEIQQSENLGFFDFGDGGPMASRGMTTLGGRIPINPSGGLESKGHPIGATGLAQIYELVTQLRGEAQSRQVDRARLALQENGGGLIGIEEAAVAVTILEKIS